jgi:hypothetical protein
MVVLRMRRCAMRKPFRSLCVLLFVVLICACGLGNKPPVFDNDLGWVFENIHPSYWTKSGGTDPGATAFRDFWVHAEDPDGQEDITYVCVTDSEGVDWLLEDHDTGYSAYNTSGNYWGGWRPYYYPSAPNRVALGTYTTVVRDSAGHEISRTDTIPGPGGFSGYSFAYTEEEGSTAGGTPMVKRATGLSGTKLGDRIRVQFSVNDSNVYVYDGFVWLYDSSPNYIGVTNRFRATINGGGGAGIYTNGSTNTLEVLFTDLNLGTHSSSEIRGFHVVLTDGAQYAPETGYDFRSISAYTSF